MPKMDRKTSAALEEALARTPWDHHVVWTGAEATFRAGSRVSRCLSLLGTAGEPVRLRTLMKRAAELDPDVASAPLAVRDAVRMHQKAKPAVYLLVSQTPSGAFHAVTDVTFAGELSCRLQAGDPVIDRTGRFVLGTRAAA